MSASVDQKFETFVEETLEEKAPTDGAGAADPMQKLDTPAPQDTSVEDLGGPTPENYKADDHSAKLKDGTSGKVSDVNTRGANAGDSAPKKMKEEGEVEGEVVAETTETESFSVEEDVNALLTGEELSEEFQEKARTIFTAAVKSRLNEETQKIEESFEIRLTEQVETVKAELAEKMDKFLNYVAEEWKKENELEIHNGIKLEMAESLMKGMASLFEENYVQLPEEKTNVLEEMAEKLDEMEEKLNEQIEVSMSLHAEKSALVKERMISEASKGLAQTQAEKLADLAEGVEFESEESFEKSLTTIKEGYFPKEKVELKEDVATDEVAVTSSNPRIQQYAAYLNGSAHKQF